MKLTPEQEALAKEIIKRVRSSSSFEESIVDIMARNAGVIPVQQLMRGRGVPRYFAVLDPASADGGVGSGSEFIFDSLTIPGGTLSHNGQLIVTQFGRIQTFDSTQFVNLTARLEQEGQNPLPMTIQITDLQASQETGLGVDYMIRWDFFAAVRGFAVDTVYGYAHGFTSTTTLQGTAVGVDAAGELQAGMDFRRDVTLDLTSQWTQLTGTNSRFSSLDKAIVEIFNPIGAE